MGVVYRARDIQLQRQVALKLLPDHFADDPDRLSRFEREAQLLASLNHPNIAQTYSLERSGSASCIVMELPEEETLAEQLQRGPIPLAEAVQNARQIVDALEAAQQSGIVHRDLKPASGGRRGSRRLTACMRSLVDSGPFLFTLTRLAIIHSYGLFIGALASFVVALGNTRQRRGRAFLSISGASGRRPWTGTDEMSGTIFITSLDTQFLVGLGLYAFLRRFAAILHSS